MGFKTKENESSNIIEVKGDCYSGNHDVDILVDGVSVAYFRDNRDGKTLFIREKTLESFNIVTKVATT